MTPRIKICGITRVEDALAAADAGADAIGLVFVEASARALDADRAAAICHALPPFVDRVGLFLDAPPDTVHAVLARVGLNWLQFHGNESAQYCRQFDRPWIKALAMGGAGALDPADYAEADALLLDSHAPGGLGGSGERFDWTRVPKLDRPWILAGGLDPGNVAAACRQLGPDAVDVSSGVESSPGVKSDKLIHEFIKAARNG